MEFRVLGPLEAIVDGRSVALGGPQQRALLALLLVHRNQVLSLDRIVDELWGETPPPTVVKTVQVYVSRLRKLFSSDVIERRPLGYLLRVQREHVDAERFEQLVEHAAGREPGSAASVLREALTLWRGPAYADVRYRAFAAAESERLEDRRLQAIEDRVEADLALGRDASLIGELEALVAGHPLRERPRHQLMLALYRCGRQADALATYRELRGHLDRQLGLEPGPALRTLERQILAHDPELALAPGAPGLVVDPRSGFVGREREVEALLSALADAAAGRGSLFLVSGEPGVGKTGLAEYVVSLARRRDAAVLHGRCWEAAGAPAYWPWVQAITGHLAPAEAADPDAAGPELPRALAELASGSCTGDGPDSPGLRFRLFESMSTFLRRLAQTRPVVLVLDDIHAADTPSLLMLEFVAAQLADARILVVATYRDVEPAVVGQLAATLAQLARSPVTRLLALGGLDRAEVARFIELNAGRAAEPEQVAAIFERTEGNPLFVGELVRLFAADPAELPVTIPTGVQTAIRQRLQRLPAPCREVLAAASVLGRELDVAVLAGLLDRPAGALLEAIEPAVASRLILTPKSERVARVRLRFSHALVRDVLYEDLSTARRADLHRRAGEALQRVHVAGVDDHLAELAHHFANGVTRDDHARAFAFARRAAQRAMRLLAYEEAARLYEAALGMLQGGASDDPLERAELLLALGEAQLRGGDESRAKETFLVAAEEARGRSAPELLARAALGYGGSILWSRAGGHRQLVAMLREALHGLGPHTSVLRVRLLARLAGALRDARTLHERDALSREALDGARRLGDHATLVYALEARITVMLWPEDPEERLSLAGELVGLAQDLGDRERLLQAHWLRLAIVLEFGELATVRAQLRAASALADELRQPAQRWIVTATAATLALFEGRFEEGARLGEEALVLGRGTQHSDAVLSHTVHRFTVQWQRGDYDGLDELIERAIVEYPARPMFRCLLALVHAETGARSRAAAELELLAAGRFAALPRTNEWLFSLSFLAEAVSRVADTGVASLLYEVLAPYEDRNGCTADYVITGSVARALGLAAAACGRLDDAIAHLERARSANAAMGGRPWLARTELDLAHVLVRRGAEGDHARAGRLLETSRALFAALDMHACAERAAALDAGLAAGHGCEALGRV